MAAPTMTHFPCRRIICLRQILTQLTQTCRSSSSAKARPTSTAIRPPSESKDTRVELEEWVSEGLAKSSLKPKQHPGRMVLPTVSVPQRLMDAASIILEKYPLKELSRRADKLANYLWSRHPPSTDAQVTKMAKEVYQQIMEKREKEGKTDPIQTDTVLRTVRQKIYHWQPVTYDAYRSLLYLTSHLAHNYTVLLHCFTEISKRDPGFQPRSVYNFGSGLGSSVWAANAVWGSGVFEHYCVDQSQDMNTVARLLLQDGDNQKQMSIPGVVFRQFAPSAAHNQFDMVVSAYTLLEQPDQERRLQLVDDLWQMTNDVLVLVENGTTAGFSTIYEARDRLLQASDKAEDDSQKCYVFAPCPHDAACPKMAEKKQPCFSQVPYKPLPQNHTRASKTVARYSYIIMRKGKRPEGSDWPRVIQDTVKASRHTHCHLCCADGKVRHMIFTVSKQGQDIYKCSRYTSWGDLFPVRFPAEDGE
ncbi:ribosome assembly protein METTL17, mitochondrial-like [Babylonia areolata]|uniref:ribosome assembly protein METTL17, mitochondrial-like n=1 Tax=Babylonia areolata TaxID=304850 RepID=UPI003FD5F36B